MGTHARILAHGEPPGAVDRACDSLAALDRAWSRFRPESELSLLNATGGGRPVVVSPSTFALISHAVDAWRHTEGRFDPTGLAALEFWGYDRTFDDVVSGGQLHPAGTVSTAATAATSVADRPAAQALVGCAGIGLDPIVRAVTLPAGLNLDLGGIGKGYAADLVTQELMDAGAQAACVDLGGDLRVMGPGPYDHAWETTFDVPDLAARIGRLRFGHGAVATSTRLRRRWRRGDVMLHHLLDPATGAPADSGLATVTVIAGDAWWAEVLAKAAFVAGPDAGVRLLEQSGVEGLLVADDGTIIETAGLDAFRS